MSLTSGISQVSGLSSLVKDKFDGNDFPVWKIRMMALFLANGLEKIVEKPLDQVLVDEATEEKKKSEGAESIKEKLNEKAKKVYGVVLLCLSNFFLFLFILSLC